MVNDQQRWEVDWYRRHGKHRNRIKTDNQGYPYVIGDADWNKDGRPREYIERLMPKAPLIRPGKGD